MRRRLLAAGVLTTVFAASYGLAPWVNQGPVICEFRALTGLNCPGCGLTRSFCACAHGRLGQALDYHWFGPLLFLLAALALVMVLVELVRRQRLPWFHRMYFSSRLAMVLAVLMTIHWVFRLGESVWTGQVVAAVHVSYLGRLWQLL